MLWFGAAEATGRISWLPAWGQEPEPEPEQQQQQQQQQPGSLPGAEGMGLLG
eukprot:COSAG02_NODE_70746_length_194_cov_25.968421_1_plen_51_part_10